MNLDEKAVDGHIDEETSLKLNDTNLLSEATDVRGTPDKAPTSFARMDSIEKRDDADSEMNASVRRSGSFNFAGRERTGSTTQNPSGALKAPAATLEDELLLAVQSLTDFDSLFEHVQQFEERAADLKKTINMAEQDSQRLGVVPQVTKACFQMLTKSLTECTKQSNGFFQVSSDDHAEMENRMKKTVKNSMDALRHFMQFKNELLAINEPILNKDISSLSSNLLKQQLEKQGQLSQRADQVQTDVERSNDALNELVEDYLAFMQDAFAATHDAAAEQYGGAKDEESKLKSKADDLSVSINELRQMLKQSVPATREQRNALADLTQKLQRGDRKFNAWKVNMDQLVADMGAFDKDQLTPLHDVRNDEIREDKGSIAQISKLMPRTKQYQSFTELLVNACKLEKRMSKSSEELNSITKDLEQLFEAARAHCSNVESDMLKEFENLIDQAKSLSDKVNTESEAELKRLDAFEAKVDEIKISDVDQFFMSKEIDRHRATLNGIDAQRATYEDACLSIENRVNANRERIASLSDEKLAAGAISPDDLTQLRGNIKQLQRQMDTDVPRVRHQIDGLESFVVKALKNQLNEDNKRSQQQLSRVKRAYEDFVRRYDALDQKYNACVEHVNNFNDKFDSEDMERFNEIETLKDRLLEEQTHITGLVQKQAPSILVENDDGQEAEAAPAAKVEDSLLSQKRKIIEGINKSVDQFNEITKLTRDSSRRDLKSEEALDELISKNKALQSRCDGMNDVIEEAKKMADGIKDRLDEIMSPEAAEQLNQKYSEKEQLVSECAKLKGRAEKQISKLDQQISKQSEILEESLRRLEMFNPILGTGRSSSAAASTDDEDEKKKREAFFDQLSELTDKAHELSTDLQKIRDEQQYVDQNLEQAYVPIDEMGEREVVLRPDIETVHSTLTDINEDLGQVESDIGPKATEIAKLQKQVKELVDGQLDARLKEGQATIDKLEKELAEGADAHNTQKKKLKYLRELIDKAQRNQGKQDLQLFDRLAEMQVEASQYEDLLKDLDAKIQDQKKRQKDAKRQIDEMAKAPTKFKPAQVDSCLVTLDDLKDKSSALGERLEATDAKIDKKTRDLTDLLACYDAKQGLHGQIKVTELEYDDYMAQLRELLDKFPPYIKQVKRTVTEMKESAAQGDDFDERKEEIDEQLEELAGFEDQLKNYEHQYKNFTEERKRFGKLKEKAKDAEALSKVHDQILEHKNNLANLLGDAADTNDMLDDLKRDVGDCNIPTLVAKRKKELQQFSQRFERANKELLNLKKTMKRPVGYKSKDPQGDEVIQQGLREVEAKLKAMAKERQDQTRLQLRELDAIQPIDYDDFSKNHDIIKKLRAIRHAVDDSDAHLREIEEMKSDVVRKLTEQDMENLSEMLAMKISDLMERAAAAKKLLTKIDNSGEAMDGNHSNGDEELLVQTIKEEMPSQLEHIQECIDEVGQLEKEIAAIRRAAKVDGLNEAKQRTDQVSQEIEAIEGVVNKLEREMLAWNAQKKLIKRDVELDEITNLCNDFLEDLMQERQNTEIELERNREKQEENRGQEMVDKDGNKVDIVQDLERLEEQMQAYLVDIDEVLGEARVFDTQKDELLEAFDQQAPKVILDERKRRQGGEARQTKAQKMKSNAQSRIQSGIAKKPAASKDENAPLDSLAMLQTNGAFRSRIKSLLKDLKAFNKRRKDLEEKYSNLRKEVFKLKQIKLYKPVAGDVVDEAFAQHLNKANLTIDVQRVAEGKYQFGERNILAKIINGRLVIRVGGGYMNAAEFIQQYGKIEMMKMMQREEKERRAAAGIEEEKDGKKALGQSNVPSMRQSYNAKNMKAALATEIKERMRQTLADIKPYQKLDTSSGRTSAQKTDALAGSHSLRKTTGPKGTQSNAALERALTNLKESYGDFKKEKSPAKKKELSNLQMRASARPKLQSGLLGLGDGGPGSAASTPLGASGMSPGSARHKDATKFFGGLAAKAGAEGSGHKKSNSRIGTGLKPRGTVLIDPKQLRGLQGMDPLAKSSSGLSKSKPGSPRI